MFLKVNTILNELNDVNIRAKGEEELSLLTESSLNVSRAFEADLSIEGSKEKNIRNMFFTPLNRFFFLIFLLASF